MEIACALTSSSPVLIDTNDVRIKALCIAFPSSSLETQVAAEIGMVSAAELNSIESDAVIG